MQILNSQMFSFIAPFFRSRKILLSFFIYLFFQLVFVNYALDESEASKGDAQRLRLGDVAVFENRQPVTAAKFIIKSSLFILLVVVIHRLELKYNSEQKVEHIFVAPSYCQAACCVQL